MNQRGEEKLGLQLEILQEFLWIQNNGNDEIPSIHFFLSHLFSRQPNTWQCSRREEEVNDDDNEKLGTFVYTYNKKKIKEKEEKKKKTHLGIH